MYALVDSCVWLEGDEVAILGKRQSAFVLPFDLRRDCLALHFTVEDSSLGGSAWVDEGGVTVVVSREALRAPLCFRVRCFRREGISATLSCRVDVGSGSGFHVSRDY